MAMTHAVRRFEVDGNPKPKVWSARICPFAERVLFALNELEVEYEPSVIDLFNKPPEFLKIYPAGKVPVIEDLGHVIVESLICIEYLDETYKSPSGKLLLSGSPVDRANYKIAVEYINSKFTPSFYATLRAPFGKETEKAKQDLLEAIAEIDAKMRNFSKDGPYFAGDQLTYVDIVLMPHTRRFVALKHYKGFEIPNEPKYKRFLQWRDTCMARPSYKKLVDSVPDQELFEAFSFYLTKQ